MTSKDKEAIAEEAPVTAERKVRDDLETTLPKPLTAPDTENVSGTWGHQHCNMSVLQQHAPFFDQNDDGIIYPWETYRGLRMVGFNPIASLFFSDCYPWGYELCYSTTDTGMYDTERRFLLTNFENIVSKYALTVPDKLTGREQWCMTQSNCNAFDSFGWIASKLEWGDLYVLAMDEQGFFSKEAVRHCFDGSLFEYCAKVHKGAADKMG